MDAQAPTVTAPIVIFAFTRPDYLKRLCLSLKAQQGVTIPDNQVHLVQDGSRSPRSGLVYGDPALLEASVEAFREVFPEGHVHAAPHNLGIAMNLHRGEKLVFDTLKAEVGYFFEEDLELGPCYVAMLEKIRAAVGSNPKLGYFAAYGNHRVDADPDRPGFIPLEHHWGFGLTRRCWRAMQPWLEPFHQVYKEVDYQGRPHLRIAELYQEKEVANMASSQDVAKTMAAADLGFARINTDVCYARYIGAKGESFRAESFEKHGYDRMTFATSLPAKFTPPSKELIERIAADKRAQCVAFRRNSYATELEAMRRRLYNPDVMVTKEQVDDLWRLLMDRVPDNAEYYERNVGKRTIRQLRTSLLRSKEAQAKSFFMK
ncbi:hypothetical protein IAI18_00225 [Acetobacteraceae bacterium H6797]|nr:hypothetical protein [Acetobacteraceae bacterium H6797]